MLAEPEQRKLAAIMFTDMAGYSALSQRDDKLAQELLEEQRQLLRKIFPRFHGAEIKTIGDAFLVEFNSALEAAQCAIEIQRTLAKRNADAPAQRQIQVRIGIHIGDVVHRGGDVYGDGVNIASRIEQLANAGGICVSMDVERQIRNTLQARFKKLAPTELKNISVPMDLFRIVLPWEQRLPPSTTKSAVSSPRVRSWSWAAATVLLVIIGVGWWATRKPLPARDELISRPTNQPANIPEKSIAVLPFENLSRDPDNAFFAAGVQEEILTRLTEIADLKVIARTSTQKFQSAPANLSDVARQLGVRNILEGSVQKAGDQVRVNVQLINTLTNAHLWAEIYDRKLTDIFSVESDIAKTVADTLRAKLTGSEKSSIAKIPTDNAEAYQLYLRGRFFWNKRTAPDLRKSIEYFNQAIEKDPNYALAYTAIAQAQVLLPAYTGGASVDCFPPAEAAAEKALQLGDSSGDAYAALGSVKWLYQFDLSDALENYQKAIQLNPNNAAAHHWLGTHPLTASGQRERAVAEIKRALELDPLSLVTNAVLGYAYLIQGRLEESAAQLRKVLEMDGSFYFAHYNLGIALELQGRFPDALAEYQKAISFSDDPSLLALLGHLYGRLGRKDEALTIAQRLAELEKQKWVPAFCFARLHLGLGDRKQALDRLEQSYSERDGYNIEMIRVDPFLAPLHGEPRFEALAEKVVPASQFASASASK